MRLNAAALLILTCVFSASNVFAAEICGTFRAPKPSLENEPANPARIFVSTLPKRSIVGNADGYLIPLNKTVDAFFAALTEGQEICVSGTSVYNPMGPQYDWFVYDVKIDSKK